MNRLVRHDGLIACNTMRATFSGWHDRVIATLLLATGLAGVRAWCVDQSTSIVEWMTFVLGGIAGLGAQRAIARRLAFHDFDGVLAADALNDHTRRRYEVGWHGAGIALLGVATLIVRPSLLLVGCSGYLAGTFLSHLTSRELSSRIAGRMPAMWTIRSWSHRPIAGLWATAVLLLSLPPARLLESDAVLTIIGIETVLLTMLLTSIDVPTVRFMTIAGHGSSRIVIDHAKGAATFLAAAILGCWIMHGPIAGWIVAAAGMTMLFLLLTRILAYRLHTKRFADVLVAVLVGLLMLVAYALPIALPVIAPAMLWTLQRRARDKTWLLP